MDTLLNKELIINGDFEQGINGWKTVNLSLQKASPNAQLFVVNKPDFDHIIEEKDKMFKNNFVHFRTGDIRTWFTVAEGITVPAGEYVWTFAVKSYSTHLMFGMYSSDEIGCDDRLLRVIEGSSCIDSAGEGWQKHSDFTEVNGKYQMQWDEAEIPKYVIVTYRFTVNCETTVFPGIRGRAERTMEKSYNVGIQSLYIDGMSLKCVKELENTFDENKEYIAEFDIENPVHDKNYAGLSAVFPCFWFLKDTHLPVPYTEEQIRISVNKFLQMGIKIVRCLAFEPSYAWDGEKHCWDWQSDWMAGFYRYCDIMKENGIDIILNTAEGLANPTSQLGRENPIYYLAVKNNPDLFKDYNPAEKIEEHMDAFRAELTNWVEDFAKEVIIKRGYDNIKYWMEGTEVNNSSAEDSKFYQWMGWAKSVHIGFLNANMRDRIKIVGPATAFNFNFPKSQASTWRWLKLCIEEFEEVIDIYAAHSYGYPYVMGDDISKYYYEFTKSCIDITEKSGKPFWHDEYNVLTNVGAYIESAEHPKHATQIVLGQICTMVSGSNTTMLWYPADIKWPNRDVTRFPSWENGVHILGLDKSILSGDAVPRHSYYTYCMLGTAIKAGDTVYKASFDQNNQLYTMLLKHTDGSYSIVTVNMSNDKNNITYSLTGAENIIFTRAVYDPATFELPKANEVGIGIDEFTEPTIANKIIISSSEIAMENGVLKDRIAPYQVIVYNQK